MARDARKLAYWAEHYRCWQSSRVSQRRNYKRAGLLYSSFDHWSRRASELAAGTPVTAAVSAACEQKLTLVSVKLNPNIGADGGGIELCSPAGRSGMLPMQHDVLVSLLLQLP